MITFYLKFVREYILWYSYSYLPVVVSFTDDMPYARGGISYLIQDV